MQCLLLLCVCVCMTLYKKALKNNKGDLSTIMEVDSRIDLSHTGTSKLRQKTINSDTEDSLMADKIGSAGIIPINAHVRSHTGLEEHASLLDSSPLNNTANMGGLLGLFCCFSVFFFWFHSFFLSVFL